MLKVLQSGFYTSIQDQGRFGFAEYGVPISGVMEQYASQFANALLGNDDSAAVLELTMLGGTFQFTEPTVIAIAGADADLKLNDSSVKQHVVLTIKTNDILSIGKMTKGFRSYLAVKGGFKSEQVLESCSQYYPITKTQRIAKNDMIPYETFKKDYHKQHATVKFKALHLAQPTIEAFKGTEFDQLSTDQQNQLINTIFTVSKNNNRMAYQLEPLLKNSMQSIITAPVLPGTVQLTPKGNLIILMRDSQTTGGYPRVLQLTAASINALAQKSIGKPLKIRLKA